ncbi:hypothetical protein Ciccas_009586 [Cichlidogyrus casuarinus]|uniref:Golgi apparatus protein 1 n=1 Tax=Cichlidogyrus casuarinus TaxID=1844966 RepID=A0ABD2PXA5_9PLAT
MSFTSFSHHKCDADLQRITECSSFSIDDKFTVPCLVDNKHKVQDKMCFQFLNRIAPVIFSDYHLIYNFVQYCGSDIEKFSCGRAQSFDPTGTHSQSYTMECLQLRLPNLESNCRNEILKIAELQSDDWHLDRALYYACIKDKEEFCANVPSGNGRVIDCLKLHKLDQGFSEKCATRISNRQRLAQYDYKVDFEVYEECKEDVELHACAHQLPSEAVSKHTTMNAVILCLENVYHDYMMGTKHVSISGKCKNRIDQLRSSMLRDYRISPELILNCELTMKEHCDKDNTLTCLIGLVRKGKDLVPKNCENAVHNTLKMVKVANEVHVDPVIRHACSQLLEGKCRPIEDKNELKTAATSDTFECLISHIEDPGMTPSCIKHMHEIAFFIARDVTVDQNLLE